MTRGVWVEIGSSIEVAAVCGAVLLDSDDAILIGVREPDLGTVQKEKSEKETK